VRWDSSVNKVTIYELDDRIIDSHRGLPSVFYREQISRSVKLTTNLHKAPKLTPQDVLP